MRAYSEDLRERIVHSVASGKDIYAVAERFEVSPRTVWRYLKQLREEGSLRPKPHPGRPVKLTAEQRTALHEQLRRHPGLTLEERCARLRAEQGVQLSVAAMQRWVKRLRYSRKKSASGPSSGTRKSAGRF